MMMMIIIIIIVIDFSPYFFLGITFQLTPGKVTHLYVVLDSVP